MTEEKKQNSVDKKQLLGRMTGVRSALLLKYPFYGMLVMNLKLSLASCGTACTDMERIIFDPAFLQKLSDEELEFVMMHEVMHCALQHCLRGKNLNHFLFNIATDIVVNSTIMGSMGVTDFQVDGDSVMHLAPDGKEGSVYTAEDVYDMLLKKYRKQMDDWEKLKELLQQELGNLTDDHDIWNIIQNGQLLSENWKENLKTAMKMAGAGDAPQGSRKLLEELDYQSKLNWKMILQNFIQVSCNRSDYTFSPVDRRFSDSDFLMPAFTDLEGEEVDNLWFVIDTSGSISPEELTMAYQEIIAAIEQFDHLQGKLSFFDTRVTEPRDFVDKESLLKIKPTGGGGTSFACIFRYMKEKMKKKFPVAVIILTDGCAEYPKEAEAMEIPVLWILINNSQDAPWGVSIHI